MREFRYGDTIVREISKNHWEGKHENTHTLISIDKIDNGWRCRIESDYFPNQTFVAIGKQMIESVDRAIAKALRACEVKTFQFHILGSKELHTIRVGKTICPFCVAARTHCKFETPGDSVFICEGEGEDHVHKVTLEIKQRVSERVLFCKLECEHITAREARATILEYAVN